MTIPQPQYISRADLIERLQQEVSSLTDTNLSWWRDHSVSPFAARYGELSHFVVAVSGQDIIFFADDEDEFGVAKLRAPDQTITDYGLAGDLKDAVQIVQTIAAS